MRMLWKSVQFEALQTSPKSLRPGIHTSMSYLWQAGAPRSSVAISRILDIGGGEGEGEGRGDIRRFVAVRMSNVYLQWSPSSSAISFWMSTISCSICSLSSSVSLAVKENSSTLLNWWTLYKPRGPCPQPPKYEKMCNAVCWICCNSFKVQRVCAKNGPSHYSHSLLTCFSSETPPKSYKPAP